MKLYLFIFVLLLLNSCNDKINLELTDYDRKELVAEGVFSPVNEFQRVKITWTTNLGELTEQFADSVKLTVDTWGGTVNFTYLDSGVYQSDVPFAFTPLNYLKIELSRDGVIHSVVTQMPADLTISSFSITPDNSVYSPYKNMVLNINSNAVQYFRYDLFSLDKLQLPDTVWTNLNIPIYQTAKVAAGAQSITLDDQSQDVLGIQGWSFDSSQVIKIVTHTLSPDVATYLYQLKTFATAEPKGARYENPPYYFSNGAYGLVYGTYSDTAICVVQ